MSHLTKTRLEAIIEAIGQRLACASETEISRREYENARDWAEGELKKRTTGARVRDRPAKPKRREEPSFTVFPSALEVMEIRPDGGIHAKLPVTHVDPAQPGAETTILWSAPGDFTSWEPGGTMLDMIDIEPIRSGDTVTMEIDHGTGQAKVTVERAPVAVGLDPAARQAAQDADTAREKAIQADIVDDTGPDKGDRKP